MWPTVWVLRMNGRSLVYSGVLLLALITASVLLSRGLVQGVLENTDIDLTVSVQGQVVNATGTIAFAEAEEVFIHQVALIADGL